MYIFIPSTTTSLKRLVESKIKRRHPSLFKESPRRRAFLNFITEGKNWWVILLFVLFIFSISIILSALSIKILPQLCFDDAKTLTDQRITNIVTITSVTLVVVGFLINNLAVKTSLVYKLLFKHTLLYPIIFFILSTIGCFIIVSTLRGTFNSLYFSNLILTGTFMGIVILFLIGFLFIRLLKFITAEFVNEMLEIELLYEGIENIKSNLRKEYSGIEFKNFFELRNGQEDNFGLALINLGEVIFENQDNESPIPKTVTDVKLIRLSIFLSRLNAQNVLYFRTIKLNSPTVYFDSYMWLSGENHTPERAKELRACLKLSKLTDEKIKSDYYQYFSKKAIVLSDENKLDELKITLKSLLKYLELETNNQAI